MIRFLIVIEQTEAGFAIQVPDLAVVSHADSLTAAKAAAMEAILINLEAYLDAGRQIPDRQSASKHLDNPDFQDSLFAYVEVKMPDNRIAA